MKTKQLKSNQILKTTIGAILFLSVSFSGATQAAKMTKMQIASHTSPMPHLMMLVQVNKNDLMLSNQQLASLSEWKHANQMRVKSLMNSIMEIEKDLYELTLEGIDQDELAELRIALAEDRSELIDLKYQCVSNIQKTLDKDQWAMLMKLLKNQEKISASAKSSVNEMQSFLRVSPMPKFMAIILMHGAELNLNPEQNKALEDWRLKNMNHWSILFGEVLSAEKQLTQDAIELKDAKKMMATFKEMTEKRIEMATMTLACRDNMKKVLTEEQWNKVVKLLKSYI